VAAHTLGRVPMTPLDMIVFIADLAAYDRAFPGVRRIRQIARANLRAGARAAVALKLEHQLRKNKRIHPTPVAVWNHLLDGK
jgi:HD superfamily phosphohydrolase YqeK